jgi:hypothetical protein
MTTTVHASRSRTVRLVLPALVAAAFLSACGVSGHSAATPPAASTSSGSSNSGSSASSSPSTGATGTGAPAIPATGAYLGAWINPGKLAASTIAGNSGVELQQLPALETSTSSRPAILNMYTPWSDPAPIAAMQSIASRGAIPLVAWGCTSTAAVSSGQDDQQITAYADSLKAYAHPVLLRWFWEMNIHSAQHTACLGSAGPAGFVTAWQHMRALFTAAGATNVAFVWSPGISSTLAKMATFFPGAASVDWIAVDGYALGTASDFGQIFGGWYSAYVRNSKPMMVAETGANPTEQAAYLASISSELPTRFPQIKAVVYFDASGPRGHWALSTAGLSAFGALARTSYFATRP